MPPPKQRTKTFTGCWTCRLRKLKCDEGRPYCQQCKLRSLKCEGYGARLQWLSPETRLITGRSKKSVQTSGGQQRCQIPPHVSSRVLSEDEIDGFLQDLDARDLSLSGSSDTENAIRGPFSVFTAYLRERGGANLLSLMPQASTIRGEQSTTLIDTLSTQDLSDISLPNGDIERLLLVSPLEASATITIPNSLETFDVSVGCQPEQTVHSPIASPSDSEAALSIGTRRSKAYSWDDEYVHWPGRFGRRLSSGSSSFTGSVQWDMISMSAPLVSPEALSSQDKFLMQYYMKRVVNLFSVVPNEKTPWKTQHLPRALQTIGEMNIASPTSRIRLALLRTLSSISAFVLSNDHKSHARDDNALFWAGSASKLRSQAIRLLKSAVETDLCFPASAKYKEFLATMLSMVTIDVMSGDTDTCAVHLAGCRQLIRHTARRKSKFSPRARALHRVYYFLQTIYRSTRPWGSRKSSLKGLSVSMHGDQGSDEDELLQDDDPWLDLGEDLPCDFTSTEFLYGVPLSMLKLLRKTTDLIESLPPCEPYHPDFEKRVEREPFPNQRCRDMELEILDWSCEAELAQFASVANTGTYQVIEQYTRGFHAAVVIFFAQHVPLMSFRYLRPYVETVLNCMETIEKIKTSAEIMAGPIFWPMFIAASESFDDVLQKRCRAWFERTQHYGVGAMRVGNEVMEEVWRQHAKAPKQYSTSLWRVVVEQKQTTLMLT